MCTYILYTFLYLFFHFDYFITELFRFYQVLSLVYFVLGCIFGPTMYEALQKEGPMHLVLQLLTAVMGLQAGSSLLIMMHLKGYDIVKLYLIVASFHCTCITVGMGR